YTKPAKLLKIRLSKLANSLEGLDKKAKTDKDSLDASFTDDPVLSQAWLNYKQTLHDIHEVIDGESVREHSRATVPSEIFFTESIVVDIPLKVDFYKHLPGIITGIGIIATFIGLLSGLLAFDPAGNPDKVQDSLDL